LEKRKAGADADSSDEEDVQVNKEKIDAVVPKQEVDSSIEVEYVEKDEFLLTGKYYDEFKNVFQYFTKPAPALILNKESEEGANRHGKQGNEEEKVDEKPISRKQRKQLKQLRVAQLKALVKRPDVVEVWDTTAKDPLTLIYLKSYKNSVAVPRHWSQKRKFLQNKRGILKPPFKLPDNVESTGIAKLRDPFNDREAGRLVRQKLRERMNPKLGKIDIDYEILHDAFFKFQAKPKMTRHGDIYFEGKEDEIRMRQYRPGKISDELRLALGISELAAPPWLINMQRYGPPPSYPSLKIPGLNAPLADGSSFGFFYNRALDEAGRPIVNMFGHQEEEVVPVDRTLWGEKMVEEEQPYEPANYVPEFDEEIPEPKSEAETRGGTSGLVSGIETPEIEVQKKAAPKSAAPVYNPNDVSAKPLYQVLEPVQKAVGSSIYGVTHGYVVPGNEKKP
jgi:splicing factor 3B subunit 2